MMTFGVMLRYILLVSLYICATLRLRKLSLFSFITFTVGITFTGIFSPLLYLVTGVMSLIIYEFITCKLRSRDQTVKSQNEFYMQAWRCVLV